MKKIEKSTSPAQTPPLSIVIKDKAALYASYMCFIKGGALFIPTKKEFNQGDKVNLLITLLDDPERVNVVGTVVWITPPGAQGARAAGIGVQLEGQTGKQLNDKIQTILPNNLQQSDPTHTM